MTASEPYTVVDVHNVEKRYGSKRAAIAALNGVDLSVTQGELVALRGPSGSGKSTLLNILGCLDRATRGRYILGGYDVSRLDRNEQAWVRLHYIGFVFQAFHLLPRASALENVMLPLSYTGAKARVREATALRLLTRVGLAERAKHLPAELSGGERQRVAIARALVTEPRLLLADEPTGALDTRTGAEILQLLTGLQREEGLTIVMVTHDPKVAAYAGRQIYLLDGRIASAEEANGGAS